MKILNQLSRFFLFKLLILNSFNLLYANEPVDIWNIEKKENEETNVLIQTDNNESKVIQGIKIDQKNEKILVNDALDASKIKLAGLYDPEENGLSIDMWSNSNGEDIKYILGNLKSKKLSNFSEKILEIALLTNSYIPNTYMVRDFDKNTFVIRASCDIESDTELFHKYKSIEWRSCFNPLKKKN